MRTKIFIAFIFIFSFYTPSIAQTTVTISGNVKDKTNKAALPFVNIVLKTEQDSTFVSGTVTDENGRFIITNIKSGNYIIQVSFIGFITLYRALFIGNLNQYLDINTIELDATTVNFEEININADATGISEKLDKKIYSIDQNISQSGGSILQAIQNLPSVTVQDGKVQLRGSDKITILIDGKQTALTGFGNQTGLDNIPASAIEKIEIINNPSAKYDANGNAGIINILFRTNKQEGFNGKAGLNAGLGALWVRRENFPNIRSQYTTTPKLNPSASLNYRRKNINAFFQGDYLYTETLNKNEFVFRTYRDGSSIHQQLKRNRNTHFTTIKAGIDYTINAFNTITISGLYGGEKIIDRGDEPFYNRDFSRRLRLWQFLEDELKTTAMATASYQHKFKEAGHLLLLGFNYTFHRENEKYFYDNILPSTNSTDAFKLISDEEVYDYSIDYIKPLRNGRLESGLKLRNRKIPTNMQFIPGVLTALDISAGGWANYNELIPAIYGNYVLENKVWEAELGLRIEYVDLRYEVNPDHRVYKTDGYNYTQPFPNLRLAYKINDRNKLSVFYNRRVDRPNEVDIRIFPKYDDAEIIKVGNPALRPQFTNSLELGYKYIWGKGSLYNAIYHRLANGTITRISTVIPGSTLIYAIFQNVNASFNTGLESVWTKEISKIYSFNISLNAFRNQINAFIVENKYPILHSFSADLQRIFSGSLKWNQNLYFAKGIDLQLSNIYLAPDIIPQGKIKSRFSVDIGLKKIVQKGKGELTFNATDLFNTMVLKKEILGQGFEYTSDDYYETQVVRFGYAYKF